MIAKILDGKEVANKIHDQVANEVKKLLTTGFKAPGIAVVMIGDNPASKIYVTKKRNLCAKLGINSFAYDLETNTSEEELLNLIDKLNQDNNVDGILVQLPLPKHINSTKVLDRINPTKDVDGFHPYNLGCLAQGRANLRSCTPKGIMTLLNHYIDSLKGLDAVILGASNIVGKPMALELINARATVTVCRSTTRNIEEKIKSADLLVAAIGKANFVQGEWIKEGAIVVDVGINRLENGKLCGDVQFDKAKERASFITPVPGGVGPMTVATLMENTLLAAKMNRFEEK